MLTASASWPYRTDREHHQNNGDANKIGEGFFILVEKGRRSEKPVRRAAGEILRRWPHARRRRGIAHRLVSMRHRRGDA